MDKTTLDRFGARLLDAHRTRSAITPLTAEAPGMSIDDAYRVQLNQISQWESEGRTIAGFKVGLTSKAIQTQFGVDKPDFGHLFSDMILDGSRPIDIGRFISPRIEPEISFALRKDLKGPGLTIVDIVDAVDYAIASVEIIDSRIKDWKLTLPDTIADNASCGALVLGTTPLRIDAADLSLVGCVLSRNGEVVASGAGAAVLGHPLQSLLFLANTLGAHGRTLPAGSVVLAGALTAAVPVAPGDRFTATFAHLGSVTASFTEQPRSAEQTKAGS
ncbi:2-keto-4-pentenoate hydratase [Rhodococcus sp. NCIMB 12038]|uniref:2-keto-4-pentenoate hydratase n=1 Tax=Rhodococcus sp. NCIMB 12038 TaxID=933800 RepID=UPI000B3C9908|nr:fumarylacetoacetate hydrolase family protein [Rhodococcus sp. NCIMB 12038]OUS80537.1 2-keto-4-pentenoate hydratase [Rhodococcus sp. NCIMB 12038]